VVGRLVADYEAGNSTTALMKQYGLGKGTVLRILDEACIIRRQRRATAEQMDEAVKLYAPGWSLVRLGEYFGASQSAVWLWLKERGVVMRRPWERANYARAR
jgi:hypothetical protein